MRLWHYKLIPVLPTKQLVSQFRECAAIAIMLEKNSLNHYIVNRVKDYPIEEFYKYSQIVANEMKNRNFRTAELTLQRIGFYKNTNNINEDIFKNWHNNRYLMQCLSYFQEKYDCGGISQEEWNKICEKFPDETQLMGG